MTHWPPAAMPFAGEPDDDQSVDQHRHRSGPLDHLSTPALRLLEPEALLHVAVGDLDAPAGCNCPIT
ncbi:MAG: hypothetical protein WCQ77_13520 [Planctomycetota bacterium]